MEKKVNESDFWEMKKKSNKQIHIRIGRSKTDEENKKKSFDFLERRGNARRCERPTGLTVSPPHYYIIVGVYIHQRATLRIVHLVIVVAVFKRHCFGIYPSLTSHRIDFLSVFRHPPQMMKDVVYQLLDIPYTTTTTTTTKNARNWENGRHCRMEMTSRISPNCV
jgi:hypothetical protein